MDEPCRKLPRGHFLFFIVAEKRKKAQQVRIGLPVKSTDGSAHIRRLGTEVSLCFTPQTDLTHIYRSGKDLPPPPSVSGL